MNILHLAVAASLLLLSAVTANQPTKAGRTAAAAAAAAPTTTTADSTSTIATLLVPKEWQSQNITSLDIRPAIGDAVNIFRSYLTFVQRARTQKDIPQYFLDDFASDPDMESHIESICSGLEATAPTDEEYKDILSSAQSLVKQNRESVLSISLLSIVLVGLGDHMEGDRSAMMVARALRRASRIGEQRLVAIEQKLQDIQTNDPALHPFAYEYYMRERRIIGRTSNLWGRVLFDEGEWNDAIIALESALESDSTIPEAYEWLARAFDRAARPNDFFKAWHKALSVDPWASDRNVWPVFCVTIQHPSVPDTPRLSINKERQRVTSLAHQERMKKRQEIENASEEQTREMKKMAQYQAVRDGNSVGPGGVRVSNQFDRLMEVITAVRTLECTPKFVGDRNHAMHLYHEKMISNNQKVRDYSYINFAYGMVFYHGFYRVFTTHPIAIDAITRTRARQLDWVSFGSNVGTETFYSALTWNINSFGYDVLCSLVDYSLLFRTKFSLEKKTNFYCKDALDSDLSNAGVIWIDNQSWDEHLTNSIYTKLNQDMLPGSIVIEYAMSDFHAGSTLFLGDALDVIGCSKLEVSWDNKAGTTISIFQKRESSYSANYYDWSDYGYLLRKHLISCRRMINDVNSNVLQGPLTVLASNNDGDGGNSGGDEKLLNIMNELQTLEIIQREDPFILSSERYTNRVMTLYSTILFNWYYTSSFSKLPSEDTSTNGSGASAARSMPGTTAKKWTSSELTYLRTFVQHSGHEFRSYNLNGQWIGNRMSGYSYSHLFDTTSEDISTLKRSRIGTTINFKEMWIAAKNVLDDYKIDLDADIVKHLNKNQGHGSLYSFHGLGWDTDEKDHSNHPKLKIFIMYHNYNALDQKYTNMLEPGISLFCLEHGLLSFVHEINHDTHGASITTTTQSETRIILYPKDVSDARDAGLDVPAYTGTTALMFTSGERGLIPLYDLERNRLCAWYSQFPKNAASVVDQWSHIGGNLETVSYVSDTKFALYFPSISS